MDTLIIAVIALVLLATVLARFADWLRRHQTREPDYRLKPRLLSVAEMNAFRVLLLAKPPELLLLASVRLADIIQQAAARRNHSAYRTQLNRIIQKQLDFVLCDPKTTGPLLALELQDGSHNNEKRRKRDRFVTEALHEAGIPVLLVRAAHSYQPGDLRRQIAELLERNKSEEGRTNPS